MQITTGKEIELKILLKGTEPACCCCRSGADPAPVRPFSPAWVPPAVAWVPLVVGAWWHPGADRCFSPAPLFPKLFPDALPSPASQAVPGEPAATPDRAGPAPGRWLEAGGRCPRRSRQRARAAGAAGAWLGLPGTPATAGGDASLAFPPFLSFFFSPPCCLLFALGLPAGLILLQTAVGIRLLEGRRRGKQKAPKMPSPVI